MKKVVFFPPFVFCPPKVGPVVCVSFLQGEFWVWILRFGLSFCLFFLCWAWLSEVIILSADDWVGMFVLFVV